MAFAGSLSQHFYPYSDKGDSAGLHWTTQREASPHSPDLPAVGTLLRSPCKTSSFYGGHMEEILSGVSILNSCFSVNHEIDCISSLYWLLGSLEPKLETTYSKYTELNPNYILFFLLLPQIFTFAYFLILLKCTYLHMLLDIYFEWAGCRNWFLMVE